MEGSTTQPRSSDGGFSAAAISVRISYIDHYMARISEHSSSPEFLDALQDAPESLRLNKVPVVRIFGPSPSGVKCCVHLHGILPYFYVPLPKGTPSEEALNCAKTLHVALERLISLSFSGGKEEKSREQLEKENDGPAKPDIERFIFQVIPVLKKGIYGYQPHETVFLKIVAFNPAHISRLASMCITGAVEELGVLQPYESHLSFTLQVLVDLNLTGMGFINFEDFKVRTARQLSSSLSSPEGNSERSQATQQYANRAWKFPVHRRSLSDLEIDTFVMNVLNYSASSVEQAGRKLVRTLGELWEEERRRRVAKYVGEGADAREAERTVRREMSTKDTSVRSKVAGRDCTEKNFLNDLNRLRQTQSPETSQNIPTLTGPTKDCIPATVADGPREVAEGWVQTYNADGLYQETERPEINLSDRDALLSKLLAAGKENEDESVGNISSEGEDDEKADQDQNIADIHESSQKWSIAADGADDVYFRKAKRKRRSRGSGEYAPLPLETDQAGRLGLGQPDESNVASEKTSRVNTARVSPVEKQPEDRIEEDTRDSLNNEKPSIEERPSSRSAISQSPSGDLELDNSAVDYHSRRGRLGRRHPRVRFSIAAITQEDASLSGGLTSGNPDSPDINVHSLRLSNEEKTPPERTSPMEPSIPAPRDPTRPTSAIGVEKELDVEVSRVGRQSIEWTSPTDIEGGDYSRPDARKRTKPSAVAGRKFERKLCGVIKSIRSPPSRASVLSSKTKFRIASVPTPQPFYSVPNDAPKEAPTFGGKTFNIPSGSVFGPVALPLLEGSRDQSRTPITTITPSRPPPLRHIIQLEHSKDKGVTVYETRIDSAGREVRERVLKERVYSFSSIAKAQMSEGSETFLSLKTDRRAFQNDSSSEDSLQLGSANHISRSIEKETDDITVLTQRPPSPKYDEGYGFARPLRRVSTTKIDNRLSFGRTQGLKGPLQEMSALNHQPSKLAGGTAAVPFQGLHENQGLSVVVVEVYAESRRQMLSDPRFDAVRIAVVKAFSGAPGAIPQSFVLIYATEEQQNLSLQQSLPRDVQFLALSSESELFETFITTVSNIDPDIIAGWEVQMESFGYLVDRARELNIDMESRLSRMPPTQTRTKTAKNNDNVAVQYINRKLTAQPIPGRHVINIWRMARSEVKLPSYSLENVSAEVLGKRIPLHDPETLTRWFCGPHRLRTVGFILQRARTVVEIIANLDLVNRTSELARVYGLDFMSVLSRGSQFRVESVMARSAHSNGHILLAASREQVFKQPALECLPLVMEPESAFYTDPVVVLDFQSLYPSMIIAHNLCFSTMLGSVRVGSWSEKQVLGVVRDYQPPSLRSLAAEDVYVAPNGHAFVTASKKHGILPQMLKEILDTRVMVKQSMKQHGVSSELKRLLNSRQFGLKMIANVTYGYASASFSGRMPCVALADAIVQSGHSALNHCVEVIEEKWQANDARVVYGDTDSLFVRLPGASRKEAFKIGNSIAKHISSLYPTPIKLQFEKVYHPCFLVTKKRYVGYAYESEDQLTPSFDAKGIETIRRDSCGATRKILEQSLRLLFESNDLSIVKQRVQRQWRRILSGRVTMEDFIFRQEVRMGSYKDGSMPPAAIVASKQMDSDPRAVPRHGARVEYVVVYGAPGATLRQLVLSPHELLVGEQKGSMRLNATYYITKQILPAMERLFSLLGADVRAWFNQMPRPYFEVVTGSSTKGTMHAFYLSSKCCLCGSWCSGIPKQSGGYVNVPLCESCAIDKQAAIYSLSARLRDKEDVRQRLSLTCMQCTRSQDQTQIKCRSLDCPIFFARQRVSTRVREERKNLVELSEEWDCSSSDSSTQH